MKRKQVIKYLINLRNKLIRAERDDYTDIGALLNDISAIDNAIITLRRER